MVRAALARLQDASNKANAIESRFDLAYNAAHGLSLAALRWHGYRPGNRYIVFQVLPHTLGLDSTHRRGQKWKSGTFAGLAAQARKNQSAQ